MLESSLRFSLFWNLSVLLILLREIRPPSRRSADSLSWWRPLHWYDLLVGNAIFFLMPIFTTGLSDQLEVPVNQPAHWAIPLLYFVSDPAGLTMHPGLMRVLEAVLLVLMT